MEEYLIERIKQGDEDAFYQLYNQYKEKVFHTAYFITGDKDASMDILQEVFIHVYTSINQLKNPQAFSSWIYKITFNKSKRHFRWYKKHLFHDNYAYFDEFKSGERSSMPEESTLDKELRKDVLKVIDKLPNKQKLCVIHFYMNSLSIKEISEILECSEGAVKTNLSKARKVLERKYKLEFMEVFANGCR